MPPRSKTSEGLAIEATLWDAANKLRGNMDSAEYKHVALGLIFLKYVSDAFAEQRTYLETTLSDPDSEDYIEDETDRQEILESRGWRIHRVWSTDWWMNSDGETKRLIEAIESLRRRT